jgi:sugar phosphate isomerase/epimerase
MMKPAFSSVAFSDWTLTQLAERAQAWGYLGVELRSYGHGSTTSACDPALTSSEKVRRLFERSGISIASLATSVRFDEVVTPPVIGHVITDTERSVRAGKGMVSLAIALECPLVRVFGFEIESNERIASGIRRIADRLFKVCDHADRTGVRVMIENGGSFSTAAELSELMDAVSHPLLCAAYNAPVANAAGEDSASGINVLGDRMACLKLRDFAKGRACALGEGSLDNRAAVRAAAKAGFDGWVVYEYDRAWFVDARPALPEPASVYESSARTLFGWIREFSEPEQTPAPKAAAVPMAARR